MYCTVINTDAHISQIEKINANFCPKFFDLYASIYGDCFIAKKIITNLNLRRMFILVVDVVSSQRSSAVSVSFQFSR